MIGALIDLTTCTRSDLTFAVHALARRLHAPSSRHQALAKRALRYIAGTTRHSLLYPSARQFISSFIRAHADSDLGGCLESRRSTSGYIVDIHGGPVMWKSQKQTIAALSSAEAEYISLSACAKQVT